MRSKWSLVGLIAMAAFIASCTPTPVPGPLTPTPTPVKLSLTLPPSVWTPAAWQDGGKL